MPGTLVGSVIAGWDLGQSLWRASGYRAQDEWRRWVKALG
jgi:hypothetical protein